MLILRKKFLLYLYRTNLCHMSFHRTLENVSVSLVQKTAIEVCVCVCVCVCVRARVRTRAQLCPTFCNPMDSSPPNCYKGVCGVCVCVCVCVCLLSHILFVATPWTVVCQTPLSMEFSRSKYWNRLPFSPPGESFKLRDWTHVSCVWCTGWQILYHHASSYKENWSNWPLIGKAPSKSC